MSLVRNAGVWVSMTVVKGAGQMISFRAAGSQVGVRRIKEQQTIRTISRAGGPSLRKPDSNQESGHFGRENYDAESWKDFLWGRHGHHVVPGQTDTGG